MSLRRFFSRRALPDTSHPHFGQPAPDEKPKKYRWRYSIVRFLLVLTLLLSAIWLLLAIWYQFGIKSVLTWSAVFIMTGLLASLITTLYRPKWVDKRLGFRHTRRWLAASYVVIWTLGLSWFMSIEPLDNRDWQPEVSQRVSYERDADNPDLITFTNVRNFDWHTESKATEHWETRTVDMSKLSGVDVTNSYWMGPLIAHTLVSFRFEDDRPLAFSFEIRKEADESFSALAGFFRRYELSLIASEERDIIYTRSNARGEQVYLFPISHLQQREVKALFESYLTAADELNTKPAWYNTLTSNCTNIIFYMARIVSGDRLPWDYRIWVSGWLPNYLYNVGMLDANPEKTGQPWSMETWYERTHINPKVRGFDNQISSSVLASGHPTRSDFSTQIRQGIPIPPLANSRLEAESRAKSAGIASE